MTSNRQQRRHTLLTLLACGATVAQAASQTGLSERTVYRYLAEPTFRQELLTRQAETVQCIAARLTTAAPEALKALMELQASTMPAGVRRAAARDLVELSQRHREAVSLEKRLHVLENHASKTNDSSPRANPAASPSDLHHAPQPKAEGQPRRKRGAHILLHTLAAGATIAQSAAKAGVSERTVYRRLTEPDFLQQLQALQAEITQRAADLLLAGSMQATKTLLELLAASTPHSVRRAAARDVLELGLGLRQAAEVETRLLALESRTSVAA